MCLPYLVAFMVALCPLLNPFKVFQIPTVLILTSPVTKTNNNCKKIKIYYNDRAICCADPKLSFSFTGNVSGKKCQYNYNIMF